MLAIRRRSGSYPTCSRIMVSGYSITRTPMLTVVQFSLVFSAFSAVTPLTPRVRLQQTRIADSGPTLSGHLYHPSNTSAARDCAVSRAEALRDGNASAENNSSNCEDDIEWEGWMRDLFRHRRVHRQNQAQNESTTAPASSSLSSPLSSSPESDSHHVIRSLASTLAPALSSTSFSDH